MTADEDTEDIEETADTEDGEISHERADADKLEERSTAPQSDYSMRDVGIGVVVALVGMLLVFVVPLLLA